MLVRERMTPNPITVSPTTSVNDALRLMREKKIKRLPVLDNRGQLVGIVSEKDLLYASPSPATSLNVWEIHELLGKLVVEKVMTPRVITVAEDQPLEDAARMMDDGKIGGLPVMRGKTLVGIITESDLFKAFLQFLGGRRPGVRVTAYISNTKGTLAKIAQAIFDAGGDIVGLAFSEDPDPKKQQWEIAIKVQGVPQAKLVETLRPVVREIIDVRGS
ncbi:MAG: CBS domain-containing protein [Chloroflexi bacterium]|nr:CBS domain-containing protein [Chloroflexota bacterium]